MVKFFILLFIEEVRFRAYGLNHSNILLLSHRTYWDFIDRYFLWYQTQITMPIPWTWRYVSNKNQSYWSKKQIFIYLASPASNRLQNISSFRFYAKRLPTRKKTFNINNSYFNEFFNEQKSWESFSVLFLSFFFMIKMS